MKLKGKKIGIFIESDYFEKEIFYYQFRFPEEGAELVFFTRLWGQASITFEGHEYKVPMTCDKSFEAINDEQLKTFDAIIVPAGMVSDRLRYTEDVTATPPACSFLKRAFANKDILKGIICHGLWLCAPVKEVIEGRTLTTHNNLIGDARAYGANYVDQDVVVDGDLVTGRTGMHAHLFASKIIELLSS